MIATMAMTPVEALMDQLGPCVLLGIPAGEKGPRIREWQKLTQEHMTPEYLSELNHGGNIGVSLGNASGGLCTIDADTDTFLESFLSANPDLRESMISKGVRGGNVWVRVEGDYPRPAKLRLNGVDWGEWRADGNQTVIYGTHPSGCIYSHNSKLPAVIKFQAINWPKGMRAPWLPNDEPPRGREEFFILPSGHVGYCESARGIFSFIAPTHTLFTRAGAIVEAAPADDGYLLLRPVTPIAFTSRLEGYGCRVAAWRASNNGDGTFALKIAQCSVDAAAKLLETLEAEELLPRIRTIVAAPILAQDGKTITVLPKGYHKLNGGMLIAGGESPPMVEIDEAREALASLVADFDFPTPGDFARAVASLISPCLKFGRFLGDADFPLDIAEAKASQSGKTYRQKAVAAIYGEHAYVINMRNGGVGSLDESISSAMLAGRPIISIDNMRGRVDSQIMESALRGHGSVEVSGFRKAPVQISPRYFLWQLSSNGADMTRDLANRSIIVRNRKREPGYRFKQWPEVALVEHIRAKQAYYLGCVFSVVAQWLNYGRPSTDESRHDFREWVRAMDWICQRVIGTAPILDGHQAEQERIGNPNLVWLRNVAIAVRMEAELGRELSASRLAEICATGLVLYPGGKSETDDQKATLYVGRLMRQIFSEDDAITADTFSITRITREEKDENYVMRKIHRYVFEEVSQ
jgi:hypothetical protein